VGGVKINLGSGRDPQDGYVNLDAAPVPGADIVHDLDVAPWPFKDGEADEIRAVDIFEHVNNPITFMTECHRVLTPGGVLTIQTTFWRSETAFTDPTHRRFCTPHTFDYWLPGTPLYENNPAYGGVSFQKVHLGPSGTEMIVILRKPT
jgi:cyclopropane fatty-acyl-phospholipid synthase-like methyltransferase